MKRANEQRVSAALTLVRLAAAATLLFVALFAVFPVPARILWIPALAATEFGHFLVVVCLVVAGPGWGNARQTLAFALSLAAAVAFASPILRAFAVAAQVQREGQTQWGQPHSVSSRAKAFALRRLVLGSQPEAPVERHLFDPEHGLELEAYGPFNGAARPLVVAIHGGSWSSGDYEQLPGINHYLANRGFAVAAITYRLAPQHTFPKQLHDVFTAVDWLKRNSARLAIDPQRIALLGRSAGGQLALLAAYVADDPAIKGVVSYYGPTDMTYAWAHPTNPWVLDTPTALKEYLGGTPGELPERYRAASPLEFVGDSTPPTLLIHGLRDELVFHHHSERLSRRLSAHGVKHWVVSLPWATHGLEANLTGPSGQISTWAVERFLTRVFAPAPPASHASP